MVHLLFGIHNPTKTSHEHDQECFDGAKNMPRENHQGCYESCNRCAKTREELQALIVLNPFTNLPVIICSGQNN